MFSQSCHCSGPEAYTGYPVGWSAHKHHAEWHLYFSSEERKASSPQSLLQVHSSYFGVRHKEVIFEGTQRRTQKSHSWLSSHVRILKSACSSSSCPRTRGDLEGQRTHHPSQEAGLSAVGGCTLPSSHCRLELPLFLGGKEVAEVGSVSYPSWSTTSHG